MSPATGPCSEGRCTLTPPPAPPRQPPPAVALALAGRAGCRKRCCDGSGVAAIGATSRRWRLAGCARPPAAAGENVEGNASTASPVAPAGGGVIGMATLSPKPPLAPALPATGGDLLPPAASPAAVRAAGHRGAPRATGKGIIDARGATGPPPPPAVAADAAPDATDGRAATSGAPAPSAARASCSSRIWAR